MHAGGEYHGHWRGTPHYLCPELKAFGSNRGVLKYGDRVDVYAIGMTMKEVVAVSKINRRRTWQRNFEQLVQQMLHSDPSQRPTAKGITARLTPPPAHLTPAPTARLTPPPSCSPHSPSSHLLLHACTQPRQPNMLICKLFSVVPELRDCVEGRRSEVLSATPTRQCRNSSCRRVLWYQRGLC